MKNYNFFYLLILILIIMLNYKFEGLIILFLLIILFKSNLINKQKVFKVFIFLLIALFYIYIYNKIYLTKPQIENQTVHIEITDDLKKEENYIKFNTKIGNKKVEAIFFVNNKSYNNEKIKYGNIYKVEVQSLKEISNMYNNSSSFNNKGYFKSKRIKYQIQIKNPQYIKSNNSIFNILKNKREDFIQKIKLKYPYQSNYINSLMFGEKINNENLKNSIEKIGIIQLFTISGFHITFLILMFENILKYFHIQKKYINILLLIILPFYSIVAGFGVSIKRVLTMEYIRIYYYFKGEKISNFQIISLSLLINLIINPYLLLNNGFLLTYSISIFLLLNNQFKDLKEQNITYKIRNNFNVIMFSFPITININNTYNVLLPFSLIIYNYIIKFMIILSFFLMLNIILSTNILTAFILFLFNILIIIFIILNLINKILIINFANMSLLMIFFFYYFYFKYIKEYYYFNNLIVQRRNYFLLFILIIFLNVNLIDKTHIIDVGQGDSILIQKALTNKNVLIDTGPKKAEQEIDKYLKSKGIRKIDYLVLTHNHEDHVGNTKMILENYKVKNIVISENFTNLNNLIKDNSKLFQNINIIKVNGLLKTNIGHFYASPNKSGNENNNTIIYNTKIKNKDWLFMGDAEKEVEEELIKKYDMDYIDYIKLGHHGSKTSTTQQFLDETTPEKVFISSGQNNVYNHPSIETINRLKENNIDYKNTQEDGEITI